MRNNYEGYLNDGQPEFKKAQDPAFL